MSVLLALQQAFAVTKTSAIGEFDDDSVNAQITKLVQAHEQTATSSTIKGFLGRQECISTLRHNHSGFEVLSRY
jgi:hypothetical protein